jgi:soluble lytic murein transglycosylase-like protein
LFSVIAVLASGFEIAADRVERSGGVVRLHAAGGVTEIPASEVVRIEADDRPARTAAAEGGAPAGENAPAREAPKNPRQLVEEAAGRHGLPPALLHSVARAESGYSPSAVSPKGAIGVMQLMPATAARLNADPHDAEQNVDAGARLLRELLLQYQGSTFKALAAYNAGEGAVQKYGGIPPYRETRDYVERVVRNYYKLSGSKTQ